MVIYKMMIYIIMNCEKLIHEKKYIDMQIYFY